MGEGAALAMEMSDITLMDCNLAKLVYTIKMGTRVVVTIQENIFLSLLAKLLVIGLTFAGKMTLLSAIAADVGIMLIVTLNGIKLLPSSEAGMRRDKKRRIDLHQSYNEVTPGQYASGSAQVSEIV
jgi:Cd2+/Zn2+-exporting ATPase